MKRLFGLIGLTYLSVLTVVFYYYTHLTLVCIFVGSFALAFLWLLLLILKIKKNLRRTFVTVSVTAICAALSIILYTNYYYSPLIDKYSDKEVNLTGYICDEVIKTENYAKYTIAAETVNGADEKLKIQFISYTDLNINEFEIISAHCTLYATNSNSYLSDGIFFTIYTDDNFNIEKTGEMHNSLYSLAVKARKAMKLSLDSLLPNDCSSMCSAVLLGDKLSLPKNVSSSFTNTGSSFLIVVSGMHMAVIASFGLFLIKKLTKNRLIHFFAVSAFVFSFMSVTGFTPSVVRSGIMIIISYSAAVFFRTSDAVNSLGIAALFLLLPNPYAVGDVGLILSFSATLGIVLWSDRMYNYFISKLEIKSRFLKSVARIITASLSASVWIVPISTIYFGRISPLVLFISLLVQFAVESLIVCALIAGVLYMIPVLNFLAYPIALICGLLSKYIIFVVGAFAEIPFSSINSDKPYFYVWIAVSIALVVIGYVIKGGYRYVFCAVILSFVTLVTGSVIYMIVTDDYACATVYDTGGGMTVAVKSNGNVSVLSCGGSAGNTGKITDDIAEDYNIIDFLIIPNQKYKYSRYQYELISDFDCSNILVYDNKDTDFEMLSDYDGQVRQSFGNNVQFTLNLSENVTDTVFCADNIVYQLVSGSGCTMLIAGSGADISRLPDEFRNADYAVLDEIPENEELLNCTHIIYSNTVSSFKENYISLSEICDDVISTEETDVVIDLKEGVVCPK